MGEVSGGASLAEEALAHLRIESPWRHHELQRHDALEHGVEGAVDDTHAALPEPLLELIPAEVSIDESTILIRPAGIIRPAG